MHCRHPKHLTNYMQLNNYFLHNLLLLIAEDRRHLHTSDFHIYDAVRPPQLEYNLTKQTISSPPSIV